MKPGKNPSGVILNKNDYFIGIADKFIHKQQTTLVLTDAPYDQTLMEFAMVYYDFGSPVAIGAPPAELVDMVDARMLATFTPWARAYAALGLENEPVTR